MTLIFTFLLILLCNNIWRSERSHSQVIKIEICDIYMYSTYVRIYPPGGSHRQLAAEWKVAGSSPAVELWGFFLSLLFFPLSFSPFPLFLPSLRFISPPSFFPFMLAPPLQCSSIFLVIVHCQLAVVASSACKKSRKRPGDEATSCGCCITAQIWPAG